MAADRLEDDPRVAAPDVEHVGPDVERVEQRDRLLEQVRQRQQRDDPMVHRRDDAVHRPDRREDVVVGEDHALRRAGRARREDELDRSSTGPARGQASTCASQSAGNVSSTSAVSVVEARRREAREASLARVGRVAARAEDQPLRLGPGRDPLDRIGRHPQVERHEHEARARIAPKYAAGRSGVDGDHVRIRSPGSRPAARSRQAAIRLRRASSRRTSEARIPRRHRAPEPADRQIARRRRRRGPGACPSNDGSGRGPTTTPKAHLPAMPLVAYFASCRRTSSASSMPTMQPTASARNTRFCEATLL